jgi:hypothetical protein
MRNLNQSGKMWLLVSVALTLSGLSAVTAKAARLGHPTYSAAASTTAQRQINLVSDPVAAETGSTSTLYDPTVANINTITAEPGFQISEVDVLINDGEGTSVEQFANLPVGTTSFVITPESDDVLAAALSSVPSSTYRTSLDGPETGAVQVFWSPFGSGSQVSTEAASVKPAVSGNNLRGIGGADVNTHIITFDDVSSNPKQGVTLTNYANGNSKFPDYFEVNDGYSGPGFSYTDPNQIQSATVTVYLPPQKCAAPPPPCSKK